MRINCRVPVCFSSVQVPVASRSYTQITLDQTIAGDVASYNVDHARQSHLLNYFEEATYCRAPFCQGALTVVPGSISTRVVLTIADADANGNATDAFAAAARNITAAATALSTKSVDALSLLLNQTVTQATPAVVSRVSGIDVHIVFSIPDANQSGATTFATVAAAANDLASQPIISSLLNASAIWTSPVVVNIPPVVSTRAAPPPAIHTKTHPAAIAILIGLLVAANFAIMCACLWRKRNDTAREELLAEAKARRQEHEQGETELAQSEDGHRSAGTEPSNVTDETAVHTSRAPLAEHAKERVREERKIEAATRKHSPSYEVHAREDV